MKSLVRAVLGFVLAAGAFGQHGGGFGGGFGHGGFIRGGFGHGGFGPGSFSFPHAFQAPRFGFPSQGFINLGMPPLSPIPPLGLNAPFSVFDRNFRFGPGFVPSSGFFAGGFPIFGGDYGEAYPPAPNIIIVQPPAPPVMVQEMPRQVVKPEIHEYTPPAPTAAVPPEQEQRAFVIVLKDRSVHSAIAVSVQDSELHYVDTEGRHHQMSMDAVDRESTRKLNQERKLPLWLPLPSGQ